MKDVAYHFGNLVDPQRNEVRLTEILYPIDKTSLQGVGDTINAKDSAKFTEA